MPLISTFVYLLVIIYFTINIYLMVSGTPKPVLKNFDFTFLLKVPDLVLAITWQLYVTWQHQTKGEVEFEQVLFTNRVKFLEKATTKH